MSSPTKTFEETREKLDVPAAVAEALNTNKVVLVEVGAVDESELIRKQISNGDDSISYVGRAGHIAPPGQEYVDPYLFETGHFASREEYEELSRKAKIKPRAKA